MPLGSPRLVGVAPEEDPDDYAARLWRLATNLAGGIVNPGGFGMALARGPTIRAEGTVRTGRRSGVWR